jgi:hypothetical protein
MFDDFLGVHFHACMEHDKEYPELGKQLDPGGGRDKTENRGADQNTRHQLAQYKGEPETRKETAEEPCCHKDQKQADHELLSYHLIGTLSMII